MADTTAPTSEASWEAPPAETSWDRIARLRRLRNQLDKEIADATPDAVRAAKAAGIRVADLAALWDVTAAWIYTVAPARPKKPG
jgi:hypothetical protein